MLTLVLSAAACSSDSDSTTPSAGAPTRGDCDEEPVQVGPDGETIAAGALGEPDTNYAQQIWAAIAAELTPENVPIR